MPKNPMSKGMIVANSTGIGVVTREMIQKRAMELALLSGRNPPEPSAADHQQARRELTGGSELDRQQEAIESMPESERWDPVPGSAGRQAPELQNEDEDDEGLNESAQLVEEGVHEAEHDQMLEAEKSERAAEEGEGPGQG
jgi:hypothetical protein